MNPIVANRFIACIFALVASNAVAADAAGLPVLRVAQLNETPVAATPAAIVDGSFNNQFQVLANSRLSISHSGDHWYKLNVSADWAAKQPPVLNFHDLQDANGWARIRVYTPPAYRENLLSTSLGAGLSHHVRATLLPGDLHASQPIYVCLQTGKLPVHMLVRLDDLGSFLSVDSNHIRLVTAFESVQAAMLLIGLLLWLLLGDRVFAYFVGYISAQLIFAMLISGEMVRLPGGWIFSVLGGRANAPFAMLTAVLAISFIIEFCKLRSCMPRAAAVFGAIRWPMLAAMPMILYAPVRLNWLVFAIGNWLILAACVMGIGSVLVALIKGNRQARFFFVAWLPELAFTIYRVLQLQLGWDQPAWSEYGFQFSMAFATLVITVGLADQTTRARRERDIADNLAHHDPLTGAFNRRAILSRLDAAVAEAHRNETPLALLFLDVDHFKSINDSYGHAVGDRCLQGIVETIGRELRDSDWMGRYGGEEFVVVLPGANAEDAREIGERLRASVEAYPLQARGKTVRMTVSVGVAVIIDGRDNADTLLERADAALYRAKSEGRNRLSMQRLVATAGAAS